MVKFLLPGFHTSCWLVVLCLSVAVVLQLLGVPGTLLDFADSQDTYQTSVIIGYTIVSTASLMSRLSVLGLTRIGEATIQALLRADVLFRPPVSS